MPGIIEGHLHVCRRCKSKGKPFELRADDTEPRGYVHFGMRLWPKAIDRKLRFKDALAPVQTRFTARLLPDFESAKTKGRSPSDFSSEDRPLDQRAIQDSNSFKAL